MESADSESLHSSDKDSKKEKYLTRRRILQLVALGAGAVLSTALIYNLVSPESAPERSTEFSKTPDWEQDFAEMQQPTLDTGIWHYETSPDIPGYNDELQAYTDRRENVRIEPGTGLVIEAHKRDYQYPDDDQARQFAYTSGRVDTLNSLSFEYGKVEATMKLPEGEGVWPAFWILSANEIHTVNKDFSTKQENDERFYMRNGEIDIMEYYGDNPHQIEATVHTFNGSHATDIPVDDVTENFHTYGIEITPESVVWTFDDELYHRFDKKSDDPNDWPFGDNNQLYIIFNLAMGGPAGPIDDTQEPWRLEIADVAFYDYTGDR